MNIYLNTLNESWVVDRIRSEWYEHNLTVSTIEPSNADIIWIIAPWVWKKVPKKYLKNKKILCSNYHIDFNNFESIEKRDFYKRDKYVDMYHVISEKNKLDLQKLTDKKIVSIPFWVNEKIFYKIDNLNELREKFGFSKSDYLVGSFQRDTEGKDLLSPKLIKGPDIFIKIIKEKYKTNKNLVVVLTGKRRQYVINMLKNLNIPFKYFEMVSQRQLNELYNILDLYIVSSRLEGGPQSILECSIVKTPIISTNVGIASEILSESSIYNDESDFHLAIPEPDIAYKNAKKHNINNSMKKFNIMFKNLYEN